MKYSIVYTTASDKNTASEIAKHLVEKKIAACVNIINNATSIYEWEGTVQEESESLLLIKTKTAFVENVMEEIRKNHTYDVPAIYSFSLDKVDEPYTKWIEKQLT